MRLRFLSIAASALVLVASAAEARNAQCMIVSNGESRFEGVCDFIADRDGSFSVGKARGHKFLDIDPISVVMVSPGVAEVRGVTRDGINSRWGDAKRSRSDPACWIGEDFKICVY